MNPARWHREVQIAWFVTWIIGAIVGMIFAWLQTPFHEAPQASRLFLLWLPNVALYWPWSVIGAILAGLSFYVVRLLRTGMTP